MSLNALINIAVLYSFLLLNQSNHTSHYYFSSWLGFASSPLPSSTFAFASAASPIARDANPEKEIDIDVDIHAKSKPREIKILSVKDYISFSKAIQCRHEGMVIGKVINTMTIPCNCSIKQ